MSCNTNIVYVRLSFTAAVTLPSKDYPVLEDEFDNKPTGKAREKAIEAAVESVPQTVSIYLDGEGSAPTNVFNDISDSDVEEVYVE